MDVDEGGGGSFLICRPELVPCTPVPPRQPALFAIHMHLTYLHFHSLAPLLPEARETMRPTVGSPLRCSLKREVAMTSKRPGL